MTRGRTHDTAFGHEQQLCKYHPDPMWQWGVMARTPILSMCVYSDFDLGDITLSQSHYLGHGQQLCEKYPDPTWQS